MEPTPKKYRRSSVEGTNRDRLSELPDEVLVNILSFMPTLDAVRTVLIRRFGNLWTMVHSLCFSEVKGSKHPTSVSFSDFVSGVLFLHRRPTIEKFHLEIYEALSVTDMWLRFVQSKEAKVVKVNHVARDYYTLPSCVFAGQSLVSLKIHGCKIEHQNRVQVGSLKSLKLQGCSMRDNTLEKLISGCPSLEELVVCNPFGPELSNLRITSPIIKKIELTGLGIERLECPNLKMLSICTNGDLLGVADISSLSEVNMDLYSPPSQQSANMLLSLLKSVANAEVLDISADTIEQLAYCTMKGLAFPHNEWKHLKLNVWFHETCVQGVCSFVRNSPSLEKLTIYADDNEDPSTVSWLEQIFDNNLYTEELSSPCVMPQLRTIAMYGFGCTCDLDTYEVQLQLAEFLLKSAVNLEFFLFVSNFKKDIPIPEEHIAFFKQLSCFHRASANARVIFSMKSHRL